MIGRSCANHAPFEIKKHRVYRPRGGVLLSHRRGLRYHPENPAATPDRAGAGQAEARPERRSHRLLDGAVSGGISLLAATAGHGAVREIFRRLCGNARPAPRKFPAIGPCRIRALPDESRRAHARPPRHRRLDARLRHLPAIRRALRTARRLRGRVAQAGQIQIQHRRTHSARPPPRALSQGPGRGASSSGGSACVTNICRKN